jgi:hypothetical protein
VDFRLAEYSAWAYQGLLRHRELFVESYWERESPNFQRRVRSPRLVCSSLNESAPPLPMEVLDSFPANVLQAKDSPKSQSPLFMFDWRLVLLRIAYTP